MRVGAFCPPPRGGGVAWLWARRCRRAGWAGERPLVPTGCGAKSREGFWLGVGNEDVTFSGGGSRGWRGEGGRET